MRTHAAIPLVIWLAVAPLQLASSKGVVAVGAEVRAVTGACALEGGADVTVGWQVSPDDHIAGLSDPKTLSNPAFVDYDDLLRATPEMKRLRKDGIDPNSAEGIQLTTAGQSRVQRACESAMNSDGYCSIWKAISHSDGRSVSDATATAKRAL
jgi:hypothetical protein